MRVTQLVIRSESKPGALAQICSELAKVAVNITAIMAAPEQTHGLRIVPDPPAAAKKVLDSLQIAYMEEQALAVRVTDRPGALGRATRKLAAAGININYAYGSIVKGQDQALIVLGVSAADLEKAAELI
ncbi:MAG TPA: ACT domain-containing protein [Candidatus Angelobacter sp.]|nr:ACT domain-containing protein [Candidatus Angelobacter sp.]